MFLQFFAYIRIFLDEMCKKFLVVFHSYSALLFWWGKDLHIKSVLTKRMLKLRGELNIIIFKLINRNNLC
jgi:hypothetical protein